MKLNDQDTTPKGNDKILGLLADLNSTLDLFYENVNDNERASKDN